MNDTPTRGQRERLASIRRFDQLVAYLRDELDWPISRDSFEDVDDLFYEFTPDELGIDARSAAKIESIKRLRPLSSDQPWGIFFVKFEPRRLPVVALRRLLGAVALKKRTSANPADRQAWAADDLLFVSNYGEDEERRISFAHFTPGERAADLPTLKVLGWDGQDTALHLDQVANTLHRHLIWPEEGGDLEEWRSRWRSAFRLRHRETITTAEKLSVRLAELARNIRDRIGTVLTVESKRGPLRKLLEAFQQSLVADLDEKGFADMYAQTIAYGLLSARIVDPEHRTTEDFAGHMRTSPFLRELMESFIKLGGRKRTEGGAGLDFDELGVSEVVELLDEANMEAVVADFGRRKQGEDPVIHFYEDFLTEYDKQEKVSRGVFYTPRPVVSYIVRSVDDLLRTEFGLANGLADTTTWGEMVERHADLKIPEGTSTDQAFVQILDPAAGTGTFLVEVIEIVHATMMGKWKGEGVRSERELNQLWNEYVPKHLLPRLHGYELMMAPYAIAHLKIGLKLYETGYRFESEERARIYLTNALEPAQDHSGKFEFAISALANEAEAVGDIKRMHRFTVVLGNPPYSNFGQQNRNWFILDLLKDYKSGLNERKINLDDDYIKFVRLSQHLLATTQAGVLGVITNNSFAEGITHRQMRRSIGDVFDLISFTNLHGSATLGEKSPDGSHEENVFDIRQGVSIIFCARRFPSDRASAIRRMYGDLWGSRETKYSALIQNKCDTINTISLPFETPHFFLVPKDFRSGAEYEAYYGLKEVFTENNTGVQTKRDYLTIHFDIAAVHQAVTDVITLSPSSLRDAYGLPADGRDWQVSLAKADVGKKVDESLIRRILYRPFDWRWTYFTGRTRGFLSYPRRETMKHMLRPNVALITLRINGSGDKFVVFCANCLVEKGSLPRGNYSVFPLYLYDNDSGLRLGSEPQPTFSSEFLRQLSKTLNLPQKKSDGLPEGLASEDIFHYTYAIFHSPVYRDRYAEFLKIDFPRLPLTGNRRLFRTLVQRGGELKLLHLMESPKLAKLFTEFIGGRNPEVEKVSWSEDTVWLDKAQTCGFKGVTEEVWNFHIGGYQVCQKWLKDRQGKGGKNARPGRTLSDEDITHYQKVIVAISETIRIMGEIDEVIDQHGGWPGAFQSDQDEQDAMPLRQAAEERGEYGTED